MDKGFDFNKELDGYLSSRRKKHSSLEFLNKDSQEEDKEAVKATYTDTYGEKKQFFPALSRFLEKLKTSRVKLSDEQETELEEELEGEFVKEYSEIEEKEETLVEEEREVMAEKKSLIRDFLSKLNFLKSFQSSEEYDDYEEVEESVVVPEEILDDLKVVGQISLSIMKKLPPQEMNDLKNSEDFIKFKTILKKHNFIKED